MIRIKNIFFVLFFFTSLLIFSQDNSGSKDTQSIHGHYNLDKFKQLRDELATPNMFRTASGAPGPSYYQQQVDYQINAVLDDKNTRLSGEETITYHNNSPDALSYLWVQLDQNIRKPGSMAERTQGDGPGVGYQPQKFVESFMGKAFQGGFHIEKVSLTDGSALPYTINETMMRVDLPEALPAGKSIQFNIKWWYNINNYPVTRGRSGYEHFDKDGNNLYIIAQWYPRMAVYNDVEGWQTKQFLGRGEFTLEFGNFDVRITAPADHILEATGKLVNRKDVMSKTQYKRYLQALQSYDKPVEIVTREEAEKAEKHFSKKTKTWHFKAQNVRDFAFASSRKFIYDAQAVKLGDRTVLAMALYPKEGGDMWKDYGTKTVAETLKSYSEHVFDYPYHKAIAVNARQQGMEYPMICWNYGRVNEDGTYSDNLRQGMQGVIVHEVGHNWFPMVVNSDERQWGWQDEGFNTFIQLLTQEKAIPGYHSRGYPKDLIPYLTGDQENLCPIMTQHDMVHNSGKNAYHKVTAGLYMLREFILGHELFDFAFKTYANRWKFKHPTPEDFFRSMEDASGTDLDWFWRGWWFTTEVNDIGVKDVKFYVVSDQPTTRVKNMAKSYGTTVDKFPKMLYLVSPDSEDFKPEMLKNTDPVNDFQILKDYLEQHYTAEEIKKMKNPKYFYEVIFEKPGGLVMPILAKIIYEDGQEEEYNFPAEIWRLNDKEVTRVFATEKKIKQIIIDPKEITADVNTANNYWPRKPATGNDDKGTPEK